MDDEQLIRNIARLSLERAGFTVLLADDGDTGLKMFEPVAGEVATVVLDLTMPRMDGEAAFKLLRRIKPDVKVIISSGYAETEILRRFAGESINGVLSKPYTAAQLVSRVREVISRG